MHLAGPMSKAFDPARIEDPERRGEVAWSLFNEAYERLQATTWRSVNAGVHVGLLQSGLRMWLRFLIDKTDGFVDLANKARLFARLPVAEHPDVVFYGAEVGWEAFLLRRLFGNRGVAMLYDADPAAHRRYLHAPRARAVRLGGRALEVQRDLEAVEYRVEDFFEYTHEGEFDVGIDWGLIEHYADDAQAQLLDRFRRNLRPSGIQICATPRDSFVMRTFYRAFADELNFGRRALYRPHELRARVERAGFEIIAERHSSSTCVVVSRPR